MLKASLVVTAILFTPNDGCCRHTTAPTQTIRDGGMRDGGMNDAAIRLLFDAGNGSDGSVELDASIHDASIHDAAIAPDPVCLLAPCPYNGTIGEFQQWADRCFNPGECRIVSCPGDERQIQLCHIKEIKSGL